MKHRPGVTLVEVLVSIFIMGVGMIALLTLFPLGAINISLAMRDDRAAQAVNNASAYANSLDLRHDSVVITEFTSQLNGVGIYPQHAATGPSSPVYVDPFYVRLAAGNLGTLAAPPANATRGLGRIGPSYVKPPVGSNDRLETCWFALLDDLNFDLNGLATTSGGAVQRTGRYTWAYMLRRPRLSDAAVTEMSVIVYADRATQTVAGESPYTATGTIGANTLTLNWTGQAKPRIRNGSWILDTTSDVCLDTSVTPARPYLVVRGYFYRVVDASDNDATKTFTLEVLNPLKSIATNNTGQFTIVVMENAIEVFERGTGYIP